MVAPGDHVGLGDAVGEAVGPHLEGGIDQHGAAVAQQPLDDDEVVEAPMRDQRQPHVGQSVGAGPEPADGESVRPARSGQWEYYFYIDLQGHPSQPHVAAALKDLQALCAFYKVLGTYPLGE